MLDEGGPGEITNAVEADATPLEDTFLSCADSPELLKLAYPFENGTLSGLPRESADQLDCLFVNLVSPQDP